MVLVLADVIPSMRKLIAKAEAPPRKKKADEPPPPKITHGQVWVSERFVGWQEAVLTALQVRMSVVGQLGSGLFDKECGRAWVLQRHPLTSLN